jgi:hypothetical protein
MDICYMWWCCVAESPAAENVSFGNHDFPVACDRHDGT